MYWIEVERANGKTVKHESKDLNYIYDLYGRYRTEAKRKIKRKSRPILIRTGKDELGKTGEWKF
jgi:hypothetical protein